MANITIVIEYDVAISILRVDLGLFKYSIGQNTVGMLSCKIFWPSCFNIILMERLFFVVYLSCEANLDMMMLFIFSAVRFPRRKFIMAQGNPGVCFEEGPVPGGIWETIRRLDKAFQWPFPQSRPTTIKEMDRPGRGVESDLGGHHEWPSGQHEPDDFAKQRDCITSW